MHKLNTNCKGSNILGLNTNTRPDNPHIKYKLLEIEYPRAQ